MKRSEKISFWVLAVLITLLAVFFQRMTGPTHPKKVKFELNGKEYSTSLSRSLTTPIANNSELEDAIVCGSVCELNFDIKELAEDARVVVYYKRYRSNDEWTMATTVRNEKGFSAAFPPMPTAAKLAYYLAVEQGSQQLEVQKEEPIVVRFKNSVSAFFLIPHILLMFSAMLFSTLAGLIAMNKYDDYMRYARIALLCLGVGGLIFGCFVQKQAFGAYWTGWPFGEDLTDNKTLVSFIIWVVALLLSKKKYRFVGAVVASVFVLLVYCIPHSTLGSEYDHSTGTVKTGVIEQVE